MALTYRITASAMSALTWNAAVPAGQYPEHSSPWIVRHGKAAPARPSWAAWSRAAGSTSCRHRSTLAAASGAVSVSTGKTNVSVSQNVCPS